MKHDVNQKELIEHQKMKKIKKKKQYHAPLKWLRLKNYREYNHNSKKAQQQ